MESMQRFVETVEAAGLAGDLQGEEAEEAGVGEGRRERKGGHRRHRSPRRAAARPRKRRLDASSPSSSSTGRGTARRHRNAVIDQWATREDGDDAFADIEDFIVPDHEEPI